jgi:soluble lytic murein transglycosylase
MTRHLALTTLFAAVAFSITLTDGADVVHATARGTDTIPERAVRALEQRRFLQASLILRDYLSAAPDTAPTTVLVTAEAEAGWGDWEMVERLLRGRPWLDSIASGRGWYLLGRSQLELGFWEESGSSLARYLELAADVGDRVRGLAELRRAGALREASKYDDALQAYDRARILLPQIEDWILVYSAGAAASTGDTAQVTQRLARVGAELARDWGWRLRVRGYINAKNHLGALMLAEAAAAESGMSANRRAEAWARAGEIRLLRGDSAGAREAFRRSMAIAPGGSGVEGARLLSTMQALTPNDRLQIGRVYLRNGNADRGIAGLEAYLKSSTPTAADRAAVRVELGRALFNAGRYKDAEPMLLDAADKATSTASAADALFLAARAQYRGGKQTVARTTFLRVAERYPNTDAAARAMYISADLDHDDGNVSRARERYRRTASMASDIDEVGLAHMRLGGLAMSEGDFQQAIRDFDVYRRSYPRGRRFQQATYWSALALIRLGDEEAARARLREARNFDPFSYYGGRAAQQLGGPSLSIGLAPGPQPLATHEEQAARALSRVDLLKEIGWDDAATYDMERAKSLLARTDGAIYTLAEALAARGFTTTSIALGWDIYRREGSWNARLLRIIYPFPFQNLIIPEAKERAVDPFLAAALIRQESMFNTNAVSGAGAIGLMQVMPATGRTLAKSLDIRKFSPQLLKQAEVNIHLGMAHLADALRTYGGRLPVVLASYNAGSGRIDRWREFPEFADDELFTERIPFAETRDYVKIVQNNARLYALLYPDLADQ